MVGRKVILSVEKSVAHPGEIALEARNLVVRDDRGVTRVDDVSFTLRERRDRRHRRRRRQRPVGAARGAWRASASLASGEILLNGALPPPIGKARRACARSAFRHVPEDRHRMGLVMPFQACESAMLGFHDDKVYGRGLLFDRKAIVADEAREDGGLRHPSARAAAEDRQFLRRQSAEDRAGARDRAQSRT